MILIIDNQEDIELLHEIHDRYLRAARSENSQRTAKICWRLNQLLTRALKVSSPVELTIEAVPRVDNIHRLNITVK